MNIKKMQNSYICNENYNSKCYIRNIISETQALDSHNSYINYFPIKQLNSVNFLNVTKVRFMNNRINKLAFINYLSFTTQIKLKDSISSLFSFHEFHQEDFFFRTIRLYKIIKGGFLGYCTGIKFFIPRSHGRILLGSLKMRQRSQLCRQVYFSNVHKTSNLLYPKYKAMLSSIKSRYNFVFIKNYSPYMKNQALKIKMNYVFVIGKGRNFKQIRKSSNIVNYLFRYSQKLNKSLISNKILLESSKKQKKNSINIKNGYKFHKKFTFKKIVEQTIKQKIFRNKEYKKSFVYSKSRKR